MFEAAKNRRAACREAIPECFCQLPFKQYVELTLATFAFDKLIQTPCGNFAFDRFDLGFHDLTCQDCRCRRRRARAWS